MFLRDRNPIDFQIFLFQDVTTLELMADGAAIKKRYF